MPTMVSFWASDDSELAQWEVLSVLKDEGDNYIDPFMVKTMMRVF
jgi:hypothetical protein